MTLDRTTPDPSRRTVRFARALALSLVAVVGLGAAVPRLPRDKALPQGADSPGVVTFRHATHLDEKRPDCTACHPSRFPILPTTARKTPRITHKDMEAGKACGACHDGTQATGLDDCATCHRGE